MLPWSQRCLVLLVVMFFSSGTALSQSIVADLDQTESSNPIPLTRIGDWLFVEASGRAYNARELYAISDDGERLFVINAREYPTSGEQFTEIDGTIYFPAIVPDGDGWEIFAFDGSGPAQSIADLAPRSLDVDPESVTAFEGAIYYESWKPDASTLWRLEPGSEPDQPHPSEFTGTGIVNAVVYDGALYYAAVILNELGANTVIWRYDGQSPPAVAFRDGNRIWDRPTGMRVSGGYLWFVAGEFKSDPRILWRWDGTDFPEPMTGPGAGADYPTEPRDFVQLRSTTYFLGLDQDGINQLWSLSSFAGVQLASDIIDGTSNPSEIAVGDRTLFVRKDEQIWMNDGLEFMERADSMEALGAWRFGGMDNRLYFSGTTFKTGEDLWHVEAGGEPISADMNSRNPSGPREIEVTAEGIFMTDRTRENGLLKFVDGQFSTIHIPVENWGWVRGPLAFTSWEGSVYFLGRAESTSDGSVTRYLFQYDGGAEVSEAAIIGLNEEPLYADYPDQIVQFDGRLFFGGFLEGSGYELWSWDGVGSPAEVIDLRQGEQSSMPRSFVLFDDGVYFIANVSDSEYGLYRYDGNNTDMIAAMDRFEQPAVHDGALFFGTFEGLWRYDGTAEPELIEFDFGFEPELRELTSLGNDLYFTTDDGTSFWRYDNTQGVSAFDPGVERMTELKAFGERLCYSGRAEGDSDELWCHNPIDETSRMFEINPSGGSGPADLTVDGDRMYFVADDGVRGRELWSIPYEIVSNVETAGPTVPVAIRISGAYPNPTRSTARLEIMPQIRETVRVETYDVLGRRVTGSRRIELIPGRMQLVDVTLEGLADGVYFVRITGSRYSETRSVLKAR